MDIQTGPLLRGQELTEKVIFVVAVEYMTHRL